MSRYDAVSKISSAARNVQEYWGKMSVVTPGYMVAADARWQHFLVNMEVYDLQPMNTVESFFQHLGFFMPWKWKNLKRSRKSFEELEVVFRDRDVAEYCAMCSPEKILRFTDLLLRARNRHFKSVSNADRDNMHLFLSKIKELDTSFTHRRWELSSSLISSPGINIAMLADTSILFDKMPMAKYLAAVNPFDMREVISELLEKVAEHDAKYDFVLQAS